MTSRPKKVKIVGQVTEDELLVDKILDKKHEDGIWKYFIKWIGWPSDTNDWEPLAHLKGCENMLTMEECPPNKEPQRLVGVIDLKGKLTYLVEWKKDQENVNVSEDRKEEEEDVVDRSLILSSLFQLKYPSIVISFYEEHMRFSKTPISDGAVSVLAAAAQVVTEVKDRETDGQGQDEGAEDNSDPYTMSPTESTLNLNDLDLDSTDSCGDDGAGF